MTKNAGIFKVSAKTEISYILDAKGTEYYASVMVNGQYLRSNGHLVGGWWRTNDLDILINRITVLYAREIAEAEAA